MTEDFGPTYIHKATWRQATIEQRGRLALQGSKIFDLLAEAEPPPDEG